MVRLLIFVVLEQSIVHDVLRFGDAAKSNRRDEDFPSRPEDVDWRHAMTQRLLLSESAARRLEAARGWLASELAEAGEVVLLAPSRGAADDLLRQSCNAGAGVFGVHRLSPLKLASELATRGLAERGLAPVSALGVEALAARAIARAHADGALGYFAPVAEAPGLVRALAATLRELRADEVDGDDLTATGPPGRDLAVLLGLYREELERWSLADDALLFELARDISEDGGHGLLDLPLLLLDISPRGAVETRFLKALAGRSPRVFAALAAGDEEGRRALETILATDAENADTAPPRRRLERLRRDIFRGELKEDREDDPTERTDPTEETGPNDHSVAFFSAPGEGRECVEIVRRIRDLALEGVPYDRMAVLLRDPDAYLPLVEEAFHRARIPIYVTRGAVRPHPAGRAFLALLACAAEGFSASRFAEYLSLGQVPSLGEDGAPPELEEVPWTEPEGDQLVFKSFVSPEEEKRRREADDDAEVGRPLRAPRQWERLLVDAAVIGGRERWAARLDGLAAELELRRRDLAASEAVERHRLERLREQLENLKHFALPVVDDLAALPSEASWGDWLAALSRLAGRVLRVPEQVLKVLAELRPMDRVAPVELDEVRRVLEERLGFLRTEPPPRRYGRVLVATIAEARGRAFDTVFLPGLAEGLFPRSSTEDPLLLDAARQKLHRSGSHLPTQAERVARERQLLRLAAGAADERLVVSYPNLDPVQGRSRVPSFYALDVLRAAEGRLPSEDDLGQKARQAAATRLGWPAPRDAEEAIDDAEHDLSILAGLLRAPAAEVTGRGRFILEANAALARTLRTRWLRWRPRISSADGLVEPDEATRAAVAQSRLGRQSHSPTALESYAACPYRFLLQAVLHLRPRDAAVSLERLDPQTRGSLFHEAQFELLRDLRERELLPMREKDLEILFERAKVALDGVAGRAREKLAPAIPRVFANEIDGLLTDLRGFIRAVVAEGEASPERRPAFFELAFGLKPEPGRDPASRRDPVAVAGGALLRGAIDLVEVDEARDVARVTDTKTGRAPRAVRHLVVGHGETLQPLLYALVAESMLGLPVESGRLFYCTRRGGYQSLEVRLDDGSRRQIENVLRTIDHAIAEGFLPAAPRKNACRRCDYRLVCGPLEEQRLQRKRRDRLARLEALRRMP